VSVDIELIGVGAPADTAELAALALASAAIADGHLAIELVDADRIRLLNREHRGIDAPTDVLSFPVDGASAPAGPRELGDVVICPEHTRDLREAVIHGVLHLAGMDHEHDEGEMLAVQAELLAWSRAEPSGAEPSRAKQSGAKRSVHARLEAESPGQDAGPDAPRS
jgi:probable rRNA maturation factor